MRRWLPARTIARVVVAYEAGRDGFWLARWLRGEAGHCTMVAVPGIEEEVAGRDEGMACPGRTKEWSLPCKDLDDECPIQGSCSAPAGPPTRRSVPRGWRR